jgi:putative membrane protein insertion efficiency factor
MKTIFLYVINFYQKYISIFSFGSCRYYPTCSHYAQQQFEHNNFFKALYYSIIRILRCNQYFDGGFDYPKVKYKIKNITNKKQKITNWIIPLENSYYLIVKNRKWSK